MIDHNKQIFFIHPPKSGGTSIEVFLDPERINYKELLSQNKHWNANMYRNKYPREWEKYLKISIVRNPFSRIVSLFNFFKYNVIKPQVAKCNNLTDFLDLIFIDKKFRCEGFDSIINGQKSFLTSAGKYEIDFCMRLETIDSDFIKLKKITNTKGCLPHYNGQFIAEEKKHTSYYKSFYTKEDISRVEEIYKTDLDFYQYSY